jgi:hypothetical protein
MFLHFVCACALGSEVKLWRYPPLSSCRDLNSLTRAPAAVAVRVISRNGPSPQVFPEILAVPTWDACAWTGAICPAGADGSSD